MKQKTNLPIEVKEIEDMSIFMADGCRLSARAWLPVNSENEPVPAIIEYIPYRKRDGTVFRDHLIHPYVAGHGFACLRVDMRGSGESEGVMLDEYTEQELKDAVEVIYWLSKQSWCSGNVGMMGKSWGGLNSLQVAAMAPEPLKAIVTGYTSTKRFSDDIHFKGGCLLNDNLRWAGVMLAYSARPPDPLLFGDSWRKVWLERLNAEPFLAENWLSHQTYDDYWKHGSVSESYSDLKAAVLTFGGWADNYMNAVPQLVENLKTPVKGIIGPWVHQYPHMAAPGPQIGFLQEIVSWWNEWLKGSSETQSSDKEIIYYLQDSVRPKRFYNFRPGTWHVENQLPSTRRSNVSYFLSDNGLNKDSKGAFELSVSSPANCGITQGEFFPMALATEALTGPPEIAGDQRPDDAYSLCFDSVPLTTSLSLVGRSVLNLIINSDVPQAQLIVRICDIHPDGASTKICHGLLNLSYRNSDEQPSLLKVNQDTEVNILLDETAYKVPIGHKLRIAISTSYWPFVWPSPLQPNIKLKYGKIDLPVLENPSYTDEYSFEDPETSDEWSHKVLRKGSYNRVVEDNYGNDDVTIKITSDAGRSKDLNHGLVTDQTTSECWTINKHDNLSAKGSITWNQEISRDEWEVFIQTSCNMSADESNFYIAASINAKEGLKTVFEKDFSYVIPRNFI
jgi:hypothetical protein